MLSTSAGGPTMVKTALFEALIESVQENGDGTLTFTLEGKTYTIKDTLEISKIAQDHGYIIIY
jgi:uncharacterized protein YlzI (FlbEa/FlbD family)